MTIPHACDFFATPSGRMVCVICEQPKPFPNPKEKTTMSDNENDPYIGETFQDKDPRSPFRRVRITAFDKSKGKYFGHEVNEYGQPLPFATTRRYLATTLDKRYRKVSH